MPAPTTTTLALALLLPFARATFPIAPHVLASTDAPLTADDTFPVVGLPGYDLETGSAAGLTATVTSLAAGLPLAQLSNAFSTHGVYPPHGAPIGAGDLPAEVTGSGNRVAVTLPVQAAAPYGAWGTFTYTVTDEKSGESAEGLVTVVPPHGILVGSDFAADAEGWGVVGNAGAARAAATHAPGSSGPAMAQYVYGADDYIDSTGAGASSDKSRWYFDAPSKFHGHHGLAYNGTFEFTVAAFAGDFTAASRNTAPLHLVRLECARCDANRGVTLAFPVAQTEDFYAADGGSAVRTYTVPLHERAGWLQDSANTLVEWEAPTQCAMVEVLSGLSAVRILGDFTTGHESVALDNVALRQTAGTSHVPVCAQQRGGATLTGDNDASACTCDPTPAAATLLARQSSSTAFDVKRSPAAPRNAHAAEGQGFAVPPVAGVSLSPDAFRTIREAVVKAWDYGLIGYHEEQKYGTRFFVPGRDPEDYAAGVAKTAAAAAAAAGRVLAADGGVGGDDVASRTNERTKAAAEEARRMQGEEGVAATYG